MKIHKNHKKSILTANNQIIKYQKDVIYCIEYYGKALNKNTLKFFIS